MKKVYKIISLIYVIVLCLLLGSHTFAQTTISKIPFQGSLYNQGTPVNGTKNMVFSISAVGWTETQTVQVTNGLYTVVLGSITAFPANLFDGVDSQPMEITVDGTSIGSVNVYAPFHGDLAPTPGQDFQLTNPAGKLRADLNYFENNDAGSLVLYGANDSTKAILGTTGGGYAGFLGLYDSMRHVGVSLRSSNKGLGYMYTFNENHQNVGWFGGYANDGFIQLISFDDSETFTGAALAGSFADGRLPEYYLEGAVQPNFGLARLRVEENNGQEYGAIELNRSNGGAQFSVRMANDPGGNDPTGFVPELFMNGDNSPNIQMGGQPWENGNLGLLNIFTDKPDGGGWFFKAISANANNDGSTAWGNLELYNDGTTTVNFEGKNGNGHFTGDLTVDGTIFGSIGTSFTNFNLSDPAILGGQSFADISISNDPGGADPTGYSGQLFLQGTNTPNLQIGGQSWANNNLPFMNLFGSTPDGGGWFYSNLNLNVDSDGTNEAGSIGLHKSNIAGQTVETTISFDGMTGNISARGFDLNNGVNGYVNMGAKSWEGNNGNRRGYLHLHGTEDGLPNADVQRIFLEVNDDGNGSYGVIGLKNYQDDGGGNGTTTLYLNGDNGSINLSRDAGYVNLTGQNGDIDASGTITATTITQTSDQRFKKNIETIKNALDHTLKLRGVSYQWKDKKKTQKNQIGVIAQEVEEVYPEFVHTDVNGYKSVNYAQMTAVLIEAVKELNAKVEALEGENENLKATLTKVEALENKVKRFEELLTRANPRAEEKFVTK